MRVDDGSTLLYGHKCFTATVPFFHAHTHTDGVSVDLHWHKLLPTRNNVGSSILPNNSSTHKWERPEPNLKSDVNCSTFAAGLPLPVTKSVSLKPSLYGCSLLMRLFFSSYTHLQLLDLFFLNPHSP